MLIHVKSPNISILDMIEILENNPGFISFKTDTAQGDGVTRQIYNSALYDAINRGFIIVNNKFIELSGCIPNPSDKDDINEKMIESIKSFYNNIGKLFVNMIRAKCKSELHLGPKIIATIIGFDKLSNDDLDYIVKHMDPITYENASKIDSDKYMDLTMEWNNKFEYFRNIVKNNDNHYYTTIATETVSDIIRLFYSDTNITASSIDSDFSGNFIINSADVISCLVFDIDIDDNQRKNIENILNKLNSDKLKLFLQQITNSCSIESINIGILCDNFDINYFIQTCFRSIKIKSNILSDEILLDKTIEYLLVGDNFINDRCNRIDSIDIIDRIDESDEFMNTYDTIPARQLFTNNENRQPVQSYTPYSLCCHSLDDSWIGPPSVSTDNENRRSVHPWTPRSTNNDNIRQIAINDSIRMLADSDSRLRAYSFSNNNINNRRRNNSHSTNNNNRINSHSTSNNNNNRCRNRYSTNKR